MKVISIIQPWATLIAIGEKKFETRSWERKYRGELGIHASKKINKAVCEMEPFKSVLAEHGYTASNLPTGAIIATTNMIDCLEISRTHQGYVKLNSERKTSWNDPFMDENEYVFGDYTVGRFAWELVDVKQIEPIPAKGQLGLWNWEAPECPTF